MAHKTLRTQWDRDRPVFGGWIVANSEVSVDAFVGAEYDYVGIDCQHSLMSEGDAGRLLRPLFATRTASIVRVGDNDQARIGQALDSGADGIIVPMVNSGEEAARAVSACRYLPEGIRSLGPIHSRLPRVAADLQDRASCFVMVETAQAISNIDDICATPGVTGIYVGPGDLSHSLGLPPGSGFSEARPDPLHEAFMVVIAACSKAGVVPGIHAGSGANASRCAEEGFRLLTLASDVQILALGAEEQLRTAKEKK